MEEARKHDLPKEPYDHGEYHDADCDEAISVNGAKLRVQVGQHEDEAYR